MYIQILNLFFDKNLTNEYYFRAPNNQTKTSPGCYACSSRRCSTARWPSHTCSTQRNPESSTTSATDSSPTPTPRWTSSCHSLSTCTSSTPRWPRCFTLTLFFVAGSRSTFRSSVPGCLKRTRPPLLTRTSRGSGRTPSSLKTW